MPSFWCFMLALKVDVAVTAEKITLLANAGLNVFLYILLKVSSFYM